MIQQLISKPIATLKINKATELNFVATSQQKTHLSVYKISWSYSSPNCVSVYIYVLLTVHLGIFILVINQLDVQNF